MSKATSSWHGCKWRWQRLPFSCKLAELIFNATKTENRIARLTGCRCVQVTTGHRRTAQNTNDDRSEGLKEWIEWIGVCDCRSQVQVASVMHGLCVQIMNLPFSPSGSFRIITTATLLTSAASREILGNETLATNFQGPNDGIIDAAADAIKAKLPTHAELPRPEIRDRAGEPLNSACATVCDPGGGVQAAQGDDLAANTGNQPKCAPCPAGSGSMGGNAAKCQLCQPGSCDSRCQKSIVHVRVQRIVCRPEQGQVGCIMRCMLYVVCCIFYARLVFEC